MRNLIWNYISAMVVDEFRTALDDCMIENLKPYGITKWNISEYKDRLRMVHDIPVMHKETGCDVYLDEDLIFTMFFDMHPVSIDGRSDFNLTVSVMHWN